jgi:flagellar biosynthesis protein FliR
LNGIGELFQALTPRVGVLVLVMGRVGGLVATAPLLGAQMIPVRVRAALVLFLGFAIHHHVAVDPRSAALVSTVFAGENGAGPSGIAFLISLGIEIGIGALLGLIAQFLFAGVQMAGQLAGIQMGLGMSNLIDPQFQAQVTSIALWQNLLALLLFLAVDGHHLLIRAVAESFRILPAGADVLGAEGLRYAALLGGEMFVVAMKISAPVLILVLMLNGAMGALTKVIPQLNVMVVGFGLNVAAGFFVLIASQPFTIRFLEHSFGELDAQLARLIEFLV